MTTIVNMYGGPGAGKSTSAAGLYYLLKTAGLNAELVREYVKDWAWEKRAFSTYDQLYFLGKQSRRESMLYDKVDWVVTDSPVMLNAYYAGLYAPPGLAGGVKAAVLGFYQQGAADGHRHVHVMLRRTKPYLAHGRYQDEAGARQVDGDLRLFLQGLGVEFLEVDTDEEPLRQLARQLTAG